MAATAPDVLKVFIVEDDDLTRETLCEALSDHRDLLVLGSAAGPAEAAAAIGRAHPQVALVDLNLGEESGIELIRALTAEHPDLLVMAHTVLDDRNVVFEAIKAGATSYVLKGCSVLELATALRELAAGGAPMTPRIARLVIRTLGVDAAPAPDVLSPKERLILRHIDAGLTYKEIAAREGLSVHTVHSHIKNIYDCLHAHGKKDALAKARHKGML